MEGNCEGVFGRRALAGAGARGRTGMGLPPRDFKSLASAYSATPARRGMAADHGDSRSITRRAGRVGTRSDA